MKKILLILSLAFLFGCVDAEHESPDGFDYNVVVIDGCEYIQYWSGDMAEEVTHKGDCNNPLHTCGCEGEYIDD